MEQCEKKLQGVQFLDANFDANFLDAGKIATESSHATLARSVCDQLEAYFAGDLNKWEIPLDWRLSEGFRRQALQVTYKIPYGNTLSYGEIAKKLKNPKAARAVGSAMATNPISIVVPCHRVVKGTGEIGNYGGGNSVKKKLLQLEGNFRNSDINPRL